MEQARAHIEGKDDLLVRVSPLLEIVGNWEAFLKHPEQQEMKHLQQHEKTGRPLGTDAFIKHLEKQLERSLSPRKPGPQKKTVGS